MKLHEVCGVVWVVGRVCKQAKSRVLTRSADVTGRRVLCKGAMQWCSPRQGLLGRGKRETVEPAETQYYPGRFHGRATADTLIELRARSLPPSILANFKCCGCLVKSNAHAKRALTRASVIASVNAIKVIKVIKIQVDVAEVPLPVVRGRRCNPLQHAHPG